MNLGLKDKVALVFASSKGIGKAVASILSSEGCKLMISSRNKNNLIEATNELQNLFNNEINWHVCDIYHPEQIKETIYKTLEKYGHIDILVNNCGGPPPLSFNSINDEIWNNYFNEIFLSMVRTSREVIEVMRNRNFGRIINITSITVKQPVPHLIISNSMRAAVTSYAKTLAGEVAQFGITVNNVAPGYVLTSRLYELAVEQAKNKNSSYEDEIKEMSKNVPMQRLGSPEDIGNIIAFLSSEKASYITGQTIVVDGGLVRSLF